MVTIIMITIQFSFWNAFKVVMRFDALEKDADYFGNQQLLQKCKYDLQQTTEII